jgi:hypothetical protein
MFTVDLSTRSLTVQSATVRMEALGNGSSFLCGWPIKRQEKNNSLLGHFWKRRGAAEGGALREPVRGTCQA